MALQPVDVANMALARLAARSIVSLTEASVEARACNRLFAPVRDLVLGAQDWRFATARQLLVPTTNVPLFPWSYQFKAPTDSIKIRTLTVTTNDAPNEGMANDDRLIYEEGNDIIDPGGPTYGLVINTQISTANVVYTRQIIDPSQWDSDFVSAFSIQLAAEIAVPVTGSEALATAMRNAAGQAMAAVQPAMNQGAQQIQRGSMMTASR